MRDRILAIAWMTRSTSPLGKEYEISRGVCFPVALQMVWGVVLWQAGGLLRVDYRPEAYWLGAEG
ncbi:MAG: hypothetical protein RMI90_11245 [Thermoguttaceae bacterium]|nr:hypothetical protein [Thermoguttaceae bacterium]